MDFKIVGTVIVSLAMLGATTVHAQDQRACVPDCRAGYICENGQCVSSDLASRASNHVDRGVKYQELGEYAKAIAEYELAYALVPHPEILYNLGQAERLNGNDAKALEHFEKYLALEPRGRAADIATRHQGVLKARVANPSMPAPAAERTPGEMSAIRPMLGQTNASVAPTLAPRADVPFNFGRRPYEYRLKSPTWAVLFSALPGVGHLYAGETNTGLIFLGATVAVWGLGALVGPALSEDCETFDCPPVIIPTAIGHVLLGLGAAIHAFGAVREHNEGILREVEAARPTGVQVNYAPIVIGDEVMHSLSARWHF